MIEDSYTYQIQMAGREIDSKVYNIAADAILRAEDMTK